MSIHLDHSLEPTYDDLEQIPEDWNVDLLPVWSSDASTGADDAGGKR